MGGTLSLNDPESAKHILGRSRNSTIIKVPSVTDQTRTLSLNLCEEGVNGQTKKGRTKGISLLDPGDSGSTSHQTKGLVLQHSTSPRMGTT